MYEAFSDAGYTSSLYVSGWLSASEIPTPGTPPGEYYLRVKAKNALLDESAWSNSASNPYHITVVLNAVPVPVECDQAISYNLIEGTNGSDALNGTSGPDLILAKGGSDAVDGKGGNDCIIGGNGSDSLKGGAGNDVILGGADSDSIQGENGADKLYGEAGSDSLQGGVGNDDLWGGAGSDSLQGDADTDTADGGAGSDYCSAETLMQCNP
jgi:Ca2+-binding RTX toxin-like protein